MLIFDFLNSDVAQISFTQKSHKKDAYRRIGILCFNLLKRCDGNETVSIEKE